MSEASDPVDEPHTYVSGHSPRSAHDHEDPAEPCSVCQRHRLNPIHLHQPIKLFYEAEVGDRAYVWRCPPDMEYGWVSDPEFFEDDDEPITVKRQVWKLDREQQVRWHPTTELCPKCDGEEQLERECDCNRETVESGECTCGPYPCPLCVLHPGQHPLAGTWEEL